MVVLSMVIELTPRNIDVLYSKTSMNPRIYKYN